MKYLIMSKGPALTANASADALGVAKDKLQAAMDSGKIEACYSLVAGGSVWVINADNHGALARAMRVLHLASVHDVEVYPILDGMSVLDAHISHKAG